MATLTTMTRKELEAYAVGLGMTTEEASAYENKPALITAIEALEAAKAETTDTGSEETASTENADTTNTEGEAEKTETDASATETKTDTTNTGSEETAKETAKVETEVDPIETKAKELMAKSNIKQIWYDTVKGHWFTKQAYAENFEKKHGRSLTLYKV